MGTWKITVEGCGCHHNSKREIDADLATKDFVDELKKQGHTIKSAKFELTDHTGKVFESPLNENIL